MTDRWFVSKDTMTKKGIASYFLYKIAKTLLSNFKHLSLPLIFILTLTGLTIASASAMVPEKASVIIGVVDRYNKPDNVTIHIFDNSSGKPIASETTFNGTAQFYLRKGVYTLKVMKEGASIEVNQRAFNVADTFQRKVIVLEEKLYFLTIKAYDSSATYREYSFNETTNMMQPSRMPNWLDNTTIRIELCAEPVAGGHTIGLMCSLPYQYIYQNDGSVRECYFWEYGVPKPDHANRNKHYGEWLHHNVKEGYFYCPNPLPKGNYTIKIWDGCHLLSKFHITIDRDLALTVYVPYDSQERANYKMVQHEQALEAYLKTIPVEDDDSELNASQDLEPEMAPSHPNGTLLDSEDNPVASRSQNIDQVLAATIDIAPEILNLKSKSKWVTCYIELPDGYDVNGIDIESIQIPAPERDFFVDKEAPAAVGDYDSDGIPDLMVKFDRAAAIEFIRDDLGIRTSFIPITITGKLTDGTPLEGTDWIKVVS